MPGLADVDRSRAGWWVLGALLAAALVYVLHSFVGTFVFGVFIYYATRPIYRRVRRRVGQRSIAAAGSLLLLMLPVVLLLWYALAIGLQELTAAVELVDAEQLEAFVGPYIDVSQVVSDPGELLGSSDGLAALARSVESASRFVGVLATGALHLFVMFALAFYMLRDDHKLSRWVHARFDDDRGVLAAYLRAVDRDFTNVFFGNILNAILTATIGAVTYSLLDLVAPGPVGIPYAALLGLLAGAASLVPVVGMKLVYFPVTGYLGVRAATSAAPSEVAWFPVAFFAVSFVVVDAIPDLVLRPYVSGRGLHLGLVMFAYVFGPLLFGWYGIFLGPMLLVSAVHFVRIVLPELLAGEPVQPYAVDPSHLTGAGDLPAVARLGESPPGQSQAATGGSVAEPAVDDGPAGDGAGSSRDAAGSAAGTTESPDDAGGSADDAGESAADATESAADAGESADDAGESADDDATVPADEPEAPAPSDGDAAGGPD